MTLIIHRTTYNFDAISLLASNYFDRVFFPKSFTFYEWIMRLELGYVHRIVSKDQKKTSTNLQSMCQAFVHDFPTTLYVRLYACILFCLIVAR